jgi:hypothetical protein
MAIKLRVTTTILLAAVLLGGVCFFKTGAIASPVSPVDCSAMSWQDCAAFVQDKLQNELAKEPLAAIKTVNAYWSPKFDQTYRALPKSDDKSDLEKIEEEVTDRINPISWAKDALQDAALKKLLPRIASIVAMGDIAAVQGILFVFWPGNIASESKELRLANEDIYRRLFKIIGPSSNATFQSTYIDALQHADARFAPTIHKP